MLGAATVLFFYPKDDSSGFTKETIAFTGLKPDFEKLNARIVGVSADSPQKHDKLKEKHDLTVTLASDEFHRVLNAFRCQEGNKHVRTDVHGR